ncbi:DUF5995 family protein [Flavobacterium enshiense]|uniref:DUF5995 family protein n=1 Tax=Flavobacterium enshiense TaxID=1341165 RepID=UPI00345DDBE4
MSIKQAKTIEDVIVLLEEIINRSKTDQSPLGYFAALYQKVTIKVKEGIAAGTFQDGPRMEQLDVVFANRYLKAYYEYQEQQACSNCWRFAFEKSQQYWPILLQHLLLGINAHINLDLGVAAAQVCPGDEIHKLKQDFDTINAILASLVDGVETALSEVWPRLKIILKYTNSVDTFLVDFSMQTAREGAWAFALELAPMNRQEVGLAIVKRDERVREIARLVSNPGYVASGIFKVVRLFERGTVADKISLLSKIQ